MEYEQWLGILTSINADNDLNESNVIEKIKEKLEKEDPGTYKEWQNNQCGVNYTLLDSQLTLLHIAAANGLAKIMPYSAIVRKCIDRGELGTSCTRQDCRCEENNESCVDCEWEWDPDHATYGVILSKQNSEVMFHNGFSCGTAAVRGNKLLEKGRHHYWEVEMLTPIYGTDVMVGVGTSKVNLHSTTISFCSLLGLDQESFGFSYVGYIQHCGKKRNYGSFFGEGSLVGVHLDMWRGTLEFWLNKKPLGIAFTGLRDIMLYPMVCSTAAHSKMRLTYSCSLPASLQTECLAVLKPSQKTYLTAVYPGLRYLSESIFARILQRHLHDSDDEADDPNFLPDFMIFDEFDFALVGAGSRKKKKRTDDSV